MIQNRFDAIKERRCVTSFLISLDGFIILCILYLLRFVFLFNISEIAAFSVFSLK